MEYKKYPTGMMSVHNINTPETKCQYFFFDK